MQQAFQKRSILASIMHGVSIITLMLTLIGAGFAVCTVSDYPTEKFSQAYAPLSSSPFTPDELNVMAVATKHYTVGKHDMDELYSVMQDINTSQSLREQQPNTYGTQPYLVEKPNNNDERYVLTPDVIEHLDDVHRIVFIARIILLSSLLMSIIMLAYYYKHDRQQFSSVLIKSSIAVLIVLALFATASCINFYDFFNFLHQFFFAQGTWVFSNDSLLICMYPLQFWQAMGGLWLITTILGCILCLIIGKLQKK